QTFGNDLPPAATAAPGVTAAGLHLRALISMLFRVRRFTANAKQRVVNLSLPDLQQRANCVRLFDFLAQMLDGFLEHLVLLLPFVLVVVRGGFLLRGRGALPFAANDVTLHAIFQVAAEFLRGQRHVEARIRLYSPFIGVLAVREAMNVLAV